MGGRPACNILVCWLATHLVRVTRLLLRTLIGGGLLVMYLCVHCDSPHQGDKLIAEENHDGGEETRLQCIVCPPVTHFVKVNY